MAILSPSSRRAVPHAIALLLASLGAAHAQSILRPVTITGLGAPPAADVTGFGDLPLKEVPVSATVIDRRAMESAGARRLADLTRFDPSVSDAYNAPGYWDFLSIRGYVLDNDYNYRREGLPVSAETTTPLDNKERIEILKGTSGMQAGISAPGGLVNFVVKRPTEAPLREVRLEFTQRRSFLAAADLGGRFGTDSAFGYRINVASESLRPETRAMDGRRNLFSLAADARLPAGGLLEGEFEWSRKAQQSQAGFSMLGDVLPAVPDPRINLNNQAWVQPSRFDALTGTLRYSQPLAGPWRFSLQAGSQRLRNDDYTAFPFGCSAQGRFDRFCSDGTFDYYDYRSTGERRRQQSLAATLQGKLATGAVMHDVALSVLRSKFLEVAPDYAYNGVGTGTVDGTSVVGPDPAAVNPGSTRDERSTEISLRDATRWTARLATWFGVRHSRLDRRRLEGDTSGGPGYRQSLTTPWAAISYKLDANTMAYLSWGQGTESTVVPKNADVYTNPGTVLPALKSRQWETGVKGGQGPWAWQVDVFDIRRPATNFDNCSTAPCLGRTDGEAHHRGIESAVHWRAAQWRAGGSFLWLDARREGSTEAPAINGRRPVNVPRAVVRAYGAWRVPAMEGLELLGSVSHEARRAVEADNSVWVPAWTTVDAQLRKEIARGGTMHAVSLGVDNLADRRYWRESPTQFGHVYLYPGARRTFRLTYSVAM